MPTALAAGGAIGVGHARRVERLLAPAIERDVRRALTDAARRRHPGLCTTSKRCYPAADRAMPSSDGPGIRTGCKVAAVDATGKSLGTLTIYPRAAEAMAESKRILAKISKRQRLT